MDQLNDTLRVFVVPTEILDTDLSTHTKMVYMVLRSYANGQDNTVFPSYSTIAKKGSMSKRKAIQCVQELEEYGLLVKEERKTVSKNKGISQTSNLYYLFRPAEVQKKREDVVNNMHHPSESDAPSLVNDMHHPSERHAPKNNHLKEPNIKEIEREKNNINEIVHLAEQIPSQVKNNLKNYKSQLQEKGVNLKDLITWLNANYEMVATKDMNLVIQQLAKWNEEVKSTIGAIYHILAKSDTYRKVLANIDYNKGQEERIKEKTNKPKQDYVPINQFNWLEN